MNLGNSLVSHCDRRKVRVLEESIVGLGVFVSDRHSSIGVSVVSLCLRFRDLAILKHRNVVQVLGFDGSLNVFGSSNVLDLHSVALDFGTFD
mgnify:CR=1 FL=1